MASESKFGKNFEIKADNRLDVLDSKKPIPESVKTARKFREKLKHEATETKTWPEMPRDLQSVEGIFEAARNKVSEIWGKAATASLEKLCKTWTEQIPITPETEPILQVLGSPETIETKLRIKQFGILEPLRTILPQAWHTLVLLSSERQLAAVTLSRFWFKSIPAEERDNFAKQVGVADIAEVEIMLDAAANFGKFVDHAYLKQIELADAPHGSDTTPLAMAGGVDTSASQAEFQGGIKYIYDLASEESGTVDLKPYSEVFPLEWPKLAKGMIRLSEKIEQLIKDGKLDTRYKKLPEYIRLCADTYNSKQTDVIKLSEQWRTLLSAFHELMVDGCPLMIVPQATPSVAAHANKVDVEIRLGFRTRESLELEAKLRPLQAIAEELSKKESAHMAEAHALPPVFSNYQPYAFGPNLYWETRGEEGMEKIVAHTNSVREVAATTALPALRKVFDLPIDEKQYLEAAVFDNILHELGHMILPKEDTAIRERIGATPETDVAEEIKADSTDLAIIHLATERSVIADPTIQLTAKLADICDYLANKSSAEGTSGERYFNTGVAIISRLLKNGLLQDQGDRFTILDARQVVAEIASFNDQFMELYRHGSPAELQTFIRSVRELANEEPMASFIKKIRA